MYVIMKEQCHYRSWGLAPYEIAKSRQIAKDRCRTLNKAAKVNRYWFQKVPPILDASGTRADPSEISF
jgi:hypothetical protein